MTALVLWLVGCGMDRELQLASAPEEPAVLYEKERSPDAASGALDDVGDGADVSILGGMLADGDLARGRGPSAPPPPPSPAPDPEPEAAGATPTRSWFPEAFLWRPLVETGDDGVAEVEVRMPDQLSTFRVLALAHDRRGQQAGAVHLLQTRLPVYVQPVVPDRLYAGDRVELPVQVVNGSAEPLSATLTVFASGALTGAGRAAVRLSPGGSDVRRIALVAAASGTATVRAAVEGGEHADAAERSVAVLPAGRPVITTVSRRVSPEPFTLVAPRLADPATEQIEVVVFGGPWSVLQSEVERVAAGARPDDPAYGFALSAHIAALAASSGVPLDAGQHKLLRSHAWQRLAALAQAPTPAQAAQLLASLRGVEGDELVDALLPRLVRRTVDGQRADGTWSRTERSTLQQVLVQTATAARALPEAERGPRLRAEGAIERALSSIDDPYTASVVLAADLVPANHRETLRAMVRGAVEERRLLVPSSVRNPAGEPPTDAEALAWAILALDEADDVAGELVAELLGLWRADSGFGAGPADVVALDAVARALPPQNTPVTLSLRRGDRVVGTATLDPAQPRVPAELTLRPASTVDELTLVAEPRAPGLVMVATRRSWVPWRSADRVPGVDVDASPGRLSLGERGRYRLAVAGPSGASVQVHQPLPAGLTVAGEVVASRATVALFPDEIVVTTARFEAGEIVEVQVPVVPGFAGRFSTAPLRVSVDGAPPVDLPPPTWTVAR